MSLPASFLDRLSKVFVLLNSQNGGERAAARRAFDAIIEDPNIDLRDIVFSNGSGIVTDEAVDHAVAMRWQQHREVMRQAYPEDAKAHDMIDRLRGEIADLKREARNDAKIDAMRDEVKLARAETKLARTQAQRLHNERMDKHPLINLLKTALVTVAADPYKSEQMTPQELRELVEAAGRDYEQFVNDTNYDGGRVLPWLRAVVRSLHPPIARRRKKNEADT